MTLKLVKNLFLPRGDPKKSLFSELFYINQFRPTPNVERSNSCIAGVRKMIVQHSIKARGRPKLSWEEVVARDRVSLGMMETNPQDRQEWRRRLRPRRRLDNQAAPS